MSDQQKKFVDAIKLAGHHYVSYWIEKAQIRKTSTGQVYDPLAKEHGNTFEALWKNYLEDIKPHAKVILPVSHEELERLYTAAIDALSNGPGCAIQGPHEYCDSTDCLRAQQKEEWISGSA